MSWSDLTQQGKCARISIQINFLHFSNKFRYGFKQFFHWYTFVKVCSYSDSPDHNRIKRNGKCYKLKLNSTVLSHLCIINFNVKVNRKFAVAFTPTKSLETSLTNRTHLSHFTSVLYNFLPYGHHKFTSQLGISQSTHSFVFFFQILRVNFCTPALARRKIFA